MSGNNYGSLQGPEESVAAFDVEELVDLPGSLSVMEQKKSEPSISWVKRLVVLSVIVGAIFLVSSLKIQKNIFQSTELVELAMPSTTSATSSSTTTGMTQQTFTTTAIGVLPVTEPILSGTNPTMYPTQAQPTMYPTAKPPTMYPTQSSIPETSAPTVEPVQGVLFTTHRVGYDYLDYFGRTPSEYLKYKILSGYAGLVEPYSDMYLYIFDEEESETSTGYTYTYEICSNSTESESQCEVYDYAEPFNLGCTPKTDTYYVRLNQYSDDESNTFLGVVATGSLMCMYVRREFRSLSERDLNATMDAMWEMYALEEDEGIALFGESFHNYARLLEYHYFNAAWKDADHIHEGNGFIAQHMKMDLIFQRSMQAIDPSITLPYWDFTIENATGIQIWDSPVFQENTFGSLAKPTDTVKGWTYELDSIEAGGITNGRWKNFRADLNEKYPDLFSAYGYMRAPWNMNPANIITRFTSMDKWLPTCESHYTLISYNLLTDFLFQVPYGAHASAHGVIGGVYGCDLFNDLLDAGYIISEDAKLNLCKNWIFYLKEFYRDNLIEPKVNCTAQDENGDYSSLYEHQSCGYDCVPDMVNILFLQLQTSILNSDYECVDVENMPSEGWVAWKEFVCTGDGYKIFGGDHLESASPADPSFWPIHPTLERLLHAKYMVGGFDTDEWPSDAINDYVCNKKTCYDEERITSDDARAGWDTWDTCCYGHFQDDQLMDAPNGDRHSGTGPTNREIMDWNNPTKDTYGIEYIYDKFDWTHCEEVGYDFEALLAYQYYNVTPSEFNGTQVVVDSVKGW